MDNRQDSTRVLIGNMWLVRLRYEIQRKDNFLFKK